MNNLPPSINRQCLEWAWVYKDADSQSFMWVCRYRGEKGKRFVPYHEDSTGQWVSGSTPSPYPVYGLDWLKHHDHSKPIFIAEGERCAQALQYLDLTAVTSPFGARSCSRTDWSLLVQFNEFIILPDMDEPGKEYAKEVADILLKQNPSAKISICQLPELGDGQDVVDWLKSQDELRDWNGFSEIEEHIAIYIKVRLLNLIDKHKIVSKQKGMAPTEDDTPSLGMASKIFPFSVPKFPPKAWPDQVWQWCKENAESMSTPPDYICATLMVVFASLVGRKRLIQPERNNPKWVVTPNLWGFVVGRSGVKKSPAMKIVLAEQNKLMQEAMEYYDLAKSRGEKVNPKRYRTEDPTIEVLGLILRDNPQGVLLFRDELLGWLKSLEKRGNEEHRAFFLEAWDGDAPFTSDRIGRGMVHIPVRCLSIFGGIQPGPLSTYVAQLHAVGSWDDGFLQRFQVAVWPDSVPWAPFQKAVDPRLDEQIQQIYGWLDRLTVDEHGQPSTLLFSSEAQVLFNEWQSYIQPRIRDPHIPEYQASHLNKFPSLITSIALILELIKGALIDAHPGEVSALSFRQAKLWCEYLETHAWKIYGSAQVPLPDHIKKIIDKIREGKLKDGFTVRDVYHGKHWTGLSDARQVQHVCDFGVDHGLLRKVTESTQGKPIERYYIVNENILDTKVRKVH